MSSESRPSLLSPWDLAAAAGLLALAVFYGRVLPLLPDPVPTHFDALGRANGWTPKSNLPWVIFGLTVLPWVALLVVGALTALVPQPGLSRRATVAPLRGLLGLGMAFLMGGCLVIPLYGLRCLVAGLVVFFLCLGLGIVLLARESAHCLASARHDGHYRWGIFYVNPDDPRLWVEKRVGTGWTLNYGRPAAIWLTALLVAPVFLVLGMALMGKR